MNMGVIHGAMDRQAAHVRSTAVVRGPLGWIEAAGRQLTGAYHIRSTIFDRCSLSRRRQPSGRDRAAASGVRQESHREIGSMTDRPAPRGRQAAALGASACLPPACAGSGNAAPFVID